MEPKLVSLETHNLSIKTVLEVVIFLDYQFIMVWGLGRHNVPIDQMNCIELLPRINSCKAKVIKSLSKYNGKEKPYM